MTYFVTILLKLVQCLSQSFHWQIPLCAVLNFCFYFQLYCQYYIICLVTYLVLRLRPNSSCRNQKIYIFP